MSDYTPEDWAAWVVEHPYDVEEQEEVVGTFGFAWFVLHRRLLEAGESARPLLDEWARHTERWARRIDDAVERYFRS